MVIKIDAKHDYYADLRLPPTATTDQLRKSYHKLALEFHPDRNAGREAEVVAKFQAVSAAYEVLGDLDLKQKYDNDRRYTTLFPPQSNNPSRSASPATPYAASSAYPPPPRRTQPGSWQRPHHHSRPTHAATTSHGADRFANFPKSPHTARKDPPHERNNMFKAWQNMNSAQDRQNRSGTPHAQQQQQKHQPPPNPPPQSSQARPRPPPPPRPDKARATEEQIRAGTKYRNVPPVVDAGIAADRQGASRPSQSKGADKPGIDRAQTTRTPRRTGFNPNAPGSDERPAPTAAASNTAKYRTEEFERARAFPPPPPGVRAATRPTSPSSPNRPSLNPTRPYTTRADDFVEANRRSTPYTSFIGEKTAFTQAEIRRSASVRDHSKLSSGSTPPRNRPQSSSPPRKDDPDSMTGTKGKPFFVYSSCEDSGDSEDSDDSEDEPSTAQTTQGGRAGTRRPEMAPEPPLNRPKKIPTPRSGRFNGAAGSPMSPPPAQSTSLPNGAAKGTPRASEANPGAQQKSPGSMYVESSPFNAQDWKSRMFGSCSTSRSEQSWPTVPMWAVPSSINPSLRSHTTDTRIDERATMNKEKSMDAMGDEKQAYQHFRELLTESGGKCDSLDMEVFLQLTDMRRRGVACGHIRVDQLLERLFIAFPSLTNLRNTHTDAASFTHPFSPNVFAQANAKSRSEENTSTNFSPEGWSGTFTGEPGYFNTKGGTDKAPPRGGTAPSQPRSATMDETSPHIGGDVPSRPWGSDGHQKIPPRQTPAVETGFNKEEWERKFQDSSWTMPPPPPTNPPSPFNGGAGRAKPNRTTARRNGTGFTTQPHVYGDSKVEVEGDASTTDAAGATADYSGDAMDIDDSPPAQHKEPAATEKSPRASENGARMCSVPPSAWRQQQDQQYQQANRPRATTGPAHRPPHTSVNEANNTPLNAPLNDLRHVEPLAPPRPSSTNTFNFSAVGGTLPFPSQPSPLAPDVATDPPPPPEIPRVPVAPTKPTNWSRASWHAHAHAFANYLHAQHDFDATLLEHFNARARADAALLASPHSASPPAWLLANGDPSGGRIGFAAYARDLHHDAKLREAWNFSFERKRKAVDEFDQARQRVRMLVEKGRLPEG